MTYDEIIEKTLAEIKTKVMQMPEDADADMLFEIARHDFDHIYLSERFMGLWLWVWERKAACKELDLFFLLRVLKCDTCCRILRNSPSSIESFIRENPFVQELLSEQRNKLIGALALAEEEGDELRANIIAIVLNNLEEQRKGKIR